MELKNVQNGEKLSMTYYLTVLNKEKDSLKVRDQHGMEFTIQGKDLIENTINSARQFTKVQKVSRTEAVNILLDAKDTVFTVNYDKADKTNRTLVGHLQNSETHFGRSNVTDLEVTMGSPIRQVDHRTIQWICINNVKYEVK